MKNLEMLLYSPAEVITGVDLYDVITGHQTVVTEAEGAAEIDRIMGNPFNILDVIPGALTTERELFFSRFIDDFYTRNQFNRRESVWQVWCERNPIRDFIGRWGTTSDHYEYVSEFDIGPFKWIKQGFFKLVREPRAYRLAPVCIPLLDKQHSDHLLKAAPYLHTRIATEKLWRGIQKTINGIPLNKLRRSDVLDSLGTFFPNSTMEMHSTYSAMHTVCGFLSVPSRKDIEKLIQDLGFVVDQMICQNHRFEIERQMVIRQLEQPSEDGNQELESSSMEPSTAEDLLERSSEENVPYYLEQNQ
jgi:hypothetical protein